MLPQLRLPRKRLLLLGILGLAFLVVQLMAARYSSAITETAGTLSDPFRTPYVTLSPRTPVNGAPTFLLFHGKRCSHSMLMPLARVLARNGAVAILIDMPGHGRSTSGLSLDCSQSQTTFGHCWFPGPENLGPIFRELSALPQWNDKKVTLIGHSWGGRMSEGALSFRRFDRVIPIDSVAPRTPGDPRPHLDLGYYPDKFPGHASFYSFEAEHLLKIYRGDTFRKILEWSALPSADTESIIPETVAGFVLLLAMATCLIGGLAAPFEEHRPTLRLFSLRAAKAVFVLLLARFVFYELETGPMLQKQLSLFRLHFFYFALAGGALALHFARAPSFAKRGLVAGLAAFLILYAALAPFCEQNIFNLILSLPRMLAFFLATLAALPLVIVSREICFSNGEESGMARALFWVAVMAIWCAGQGAWKAGSDAALYLFLLLAAEALSTYLQKRAGRSAGIALQALVIGWSSVLYPFLSV